MGLPHDSAPPRQWSSDAEPYVDDTAGDALPAEAMGHYQGLLDTIYQLALQAALKKCQPPSVLMIWIGVLFDSIRMSMAIDPVKIEEALELCRGLWLRILCPFTTCRFLPVSCGTWPSVPNQQGSLCKI